MKTQVLSLLVLVLTTASSAMAAEPNPRETWDGPGTVLDLHGKTIANYELTVIKTKTGSDVKTDVTVKLDDGKVIQQTCTATPKEPGAWVDTCDIGKGVYRELGDGFAISYIVAGDKAFATTVLMDSPTEMRLLRTELQNGKATRFFREKLDKKD